MKERERDRQSKKESIIGKSLTFSKMKQKRGGNAITHSKKCVKQVERVVSVNTPPPW